MHGFCLQLLHIPNKINSASVPASTGQRNHQHQVHKDNGITINKSGFRVYINTRAEAPESCHRWLHRPKKLGTTDAGTKLPAGACRTVAPSRPIVNSASPSPAQKLHTHNAWDAGAYIVKSISIFDHWSCTPSEMCTLLNQAVLINLFGVQINNTRCVRVMHTGETHRPRDKKHTTQYG